MKYYLIYLILFSMGGLLICFPKYQPKGRISHILAFAVVTVAMALFLWEFTIPTAYYVDFTKAYYIAGKNILSNPSSLYQGKLPEFVNIPIVALLFYPIAQLETDAAVLVLILISFGAVISTCLWVLRIGGFEGRERLIVVWLFAASGPLFYSIRLGNMTHFLLPLIIMIIACYDRKPLLAGAVAGACAIIKLPLMLLGVYFIARRYWRMAIGFWAAVIVVAVCSIALFGLELHYKWYFEAIGRYSGKVIGAYNAQSINGFIAHLMPENHLYNWMESSYGWKFSLLRLFFITSIAAGTAWRLWRAGSPTSRESFSFEFSIILCLSILVSPVSWIHYYALLLVPTALFLGQESHRGFSFSKKSNNIFLSAMLFLTIVCIIPPVFHTLPESVLPDIRIVELLMKHVVVSHYFFGGLAFLVYCLLSRQVVRP